MTLVETLVDHGPLTRQQAIDKLDWSEGRFSNALKHAREHLCPAMEVAIPAPTPPEWLYRVTDDWAEVEVGANFVLGLIDTRLRRISVEVHTILPKLTRGTKEWRRANFLAKHLDPMTRTLEEINNDPR